MNPSSLRKIMSYSNPSSIARQSRLRPSAGRAICFRLLICTLLCLFASCSHSDRAPETPPRAVVRDGVAITLRDQKLTVFRRGKRVKDYRISSSKFGMGSRYGSNRTPLGIHVVTGKVGEGQPDGMVFKGCRPTGTVVSANSGRDPIVTRVIQLAGLEASNRNSHSRHIYIHGTPEERFIGRPASYGCIRMRSRDVRDLYPLVYRGMPVAIESCSQSTYLKAEEEQTLSIVVPDALVAKLPTDSGQRRYVQRYSPRRSHARRHSSRHARIARLSGRRRSSSGRRVAWRH